jgi:formate dehydrogenase iron-sulfur subunit
MAISRRTFLISGLAATAATALGAKPKDVKAFSLDQASPDAISGGNSTPKGVLVDITRCVGCRACEIACKQWNKNPAFDLINKGVDENPWHLNASSFTKIRDVELEGNGPQRVFIKLQCMHCAHPACVAACPVDALNKEENGPVIYDNRKCIGCRYCMAACPFGVPTYQWDSNMPWVRKCTFCFDRQALGLRPACVGTCPAGALQFGNRSDMLAEASQRIQAEPAKYVNYIYGEKEVGGTSWLYLSPVPFENLGMPSLGTQPVTLNVERAMSLVPPVLLGVAATMTAVYWWGKRRQKPDEKKENEKPGVSK